MGLYPNSSEYDEILISILKLIVMFVIGGNATLTCFAQKFHFKKRSLKLGIKLTKTIFKEGKKYHIGNRVGL